MLIFYMTTVNRAWMYNNEQTPAKKQDGVVINHVISLVLTKEESQGVHRTLQALGLSSSKLLHMDDKFEVRKRP